MNRNIAEVNNKEIRYDVYKVVCIAYPYTCNKCDHAYKSKYDLQRHHEDKHGNQVDECDVCSKYFKYLTNLKQHMQSEYDGGTDASL